MTDPKAVGKLVVAEVMTSRVVTVPATEPATIVLNRLIEEQVHFVVVVDEQHRPQGIITERDFLTILEKEGPPPGWLLQQIMSGADQFIEHMQRLRRASGTIAAEIMSQPVICVEESTPLTQAAVILAEHDFNQLPVVRQGVLVGAITRSDIIKAIAATYPPLD